MRKRYAKAIDARATKLLRDFDLFSAPVDVEAVAERLGANVIFDDLDDDVSGFLLREKKVATVAVNKVHHPNRQRFTIAHECGHLLLHAEQGDRLWLDRTSVYFRDASSGTGDQFAEIQANQFAAGLLMPEALIRAHLGDEGLSELDISRLALRFQVSEQAMTLRLVSLDVLDPI